MTGDSAGRLRADRNRQRQPLNAKVTEDGRTVSYIFVRNLPFLSILFRDRIRIPVCGNTDRRDLQKPASSFHSAEKN